MSMLDRLEPLESDELSLMGYRPSRGQPQASTSSFFVIRGTGVLGFAEWYAKPTLMLISATNQLKHQAFS
jgi:hypothetical protein